MEVADMAAQRVAHPPITDRIRGEQANAWIKKWQTCAPHILLAAISGKFLTLHAVPSGTLLFTADWDSEGAMVNDPGTLEEPYQFRDVQSALIFLDGLLMSYVARLEPALSSTVTGAPRKQMVSVSGWPRHEYAAMLRGIGYLAQRQGSRASI